MLLSDEQIRSNEDDDDEGPLKELNRLTGTRGNR